jgi:N-formylglutamate deformylase
VRATFHRYVIDVNRDPSGESLYPGQNTTGLVPLTDFDGLPIWRDGAGTRRRRDRRRRAGHHAPYHAALQAELDRVKATHGFAILYDCHSIRSHIPFLFDGTLPDFNIGTNSGASCAASIEAAVDGICGGAGGYDLSSTAASRAAGRRATTAARRRAARHPDGTGAVHLHGRNPPWDYDEAARRAHPR